MSMSSIEACTVDGIYNNIELLDKVHPQGEVSAIYDCNWLAE